MSKRNKYIPDDGDDYNSFDLKYITTIEECDEKVAFAEEWKKTLSWHYHELPHELIKRVEKIRKNIIKMKGK